MLHRKIYLQSGVFDQATAKSKTLACPLPKGRACDMQQISKTSLYISILEKSVTGRIKMNLRSSVLLFDLVKSLN